MKEGQYPPALQATLEKIDRDIAREIQYDKIMESLRRMKEMLEDLRDVRHAPVR